MTDIDFCQIVMYLLEQLAVVALVGECFGGGEVAFCMLFVSVYLLLFFFPCLNLENELHFTCR